MMIPHVTKQDIVVAVMVNVEVVERAVTEVITEVLVKVLLHLLLYLPQLLLPKLNTISVVFSAWSPF